jgi:hypothetical protein
MAALNLVLRHPIPVPSFSSPLHSLFLPQDLQKWRRRHRTRPDQSPGRDWVRRAGQKETLSFCMRCSGSLHEMRICNTDCSEVIQADHESLVPRGFLFGLQSDRSFGEHTGACEYRPRAKICTKLLFVFFGVRILSIQTHKWLKRVTDSTNKPMSHPWYL